MGKFGQTEKGFVFPFFEDYKEIMLAKLKSEFGSDFEIDPNTSFGQYLEANAWTFETFSNILKSLFANSHLYDMRGNALDRYGANYEIPRLNGRKAYGDITIKGLANYIVPTGFEFVGENNLFYKLVNRVVLAPDGIGYGQIEAAEKGIIYNTDSGTIRQKATGDENVREVYNLTPISHGSDIESDMDYQLRIAKLSQATGTATANNIKAAMLRMEEVLDCKIQENDTNEYDDILKLEPGEIRAIVDGIIDKNVAYTLFNTKAAGIKTVGDTAFSVVSDSNQKVIVWLQKSTEFKLYIKIENLRIKDDSKKLEVENEIKANIKNEIDKNGLGDNVNYEKIIAAVYRLDEVNEANISISINDLDYVKNDIETNFSERVSYYERGVFISYD